MLPFAATVTIMPLFSVVIPTYNRATFVPVIIKDLQAQTLTDFEVIVVDDGSRDNTEETVRPLLSDTVHYYKKTNGERGAARNYGATYATGDYLIFFDSDDQMYPNHLETIAKVIKEKNNPPVLYTGYDVKDGQGHILSTVNKPVKNIKAALAYNNFLNCNSVAIRRDVFEKYRFNEDRVIATAEDKDLWLRVSANHDFTQIPAVTFAMIEHDGRSLNTRKPAQEIPRCVSLIRYLKEDKPFNEAYGPYAAFLYAFEYCLLSLAYSEDGQLREARKYWRVAMKEYPMIVIRKRFMAAVRNSYFPRKQKVQQA